MRIRLRLLDVLVEIDTEEEDAARLLEDLWRPLETPEAGEPARVYSVARDGDGWIATAGDAVEAVHDTLWGVTDALRYRMLELCEETLQRFVTLHAAAVARGRDLVLLAGESGAGKTTLTLALLDAGWAYLSDDVAPVETDTGLVHPFPKPLGLKDPSAWARVKHAFARGPAIGSPTGSFLVPPSAWDVATEPLPLRALLFPTFAPGTALEVEFLAPAKAVALASRYLRRVDPSTIGMLNRLCASAGSFRLRYGSSDAAIYAIDEVLSRRDTH